MFHRLLGNSGSHILWGKLHYLINFIQIFNKLFHFFAAMAQNTTLISARVPLHPGSGNNISKRIPSIVRKAKNIVTIVFSMAEQFLQGIWSAISWARKCRR
jgi:hypothetical protein